MNYMKKLTPSAIDLEVRSLSPSETGTMEAMQNFISFLKETLSTNHNFELAQAYLGLFLKVRIQHVLQCVSQKNLAPQITDKYGAV